MSNNYKNRAHRCAAIGDNCADNYDFKTALIWYERALSIYQKAAGKQNPYAAIALNQIGRMYNLLREHENALDAYQSAYDIQKELYGAAHPSSLSTLTDLAATYSEFKDYHSAIAILTRVTFLQEHLRDLSEAVMSANKLFKAHIAAGDKKSALRWLDYAADKCEPESKQFALTAYSYGEYYFSEGKYQAALSWFVKSYKSYKGNELYLPAADAASGVSKTYGMLTKLADALMWGEKALHLYRQSGAKETEAIAASHCNIAIFYHKSGEHELAAEHYELSLEIYKKLFGDEHILTARAYGNLAGLFESNDEHDKAIIYYTRAIQTIRELEHNETEEASLCNNIAVAYHRLGDYENAMLWYRDAATLSMGNDFSSATALGNIGGVCIALKQYDQAEQFLMQAYSLFKSALGEDHPDAATCGFNLGLLYAKREQYEMALEWYNRAYKYIEAAYGKDNEQARHILKKREEALTELGRSRFALN